MRGCAVVAAVATMAAPGSAGASGDSAAAAAPGTQLWAARFDGTGNANDRAASVAVSRSGDKVFVTGYSNGGTATRDDYATAAYSTGTGTQLWVARYNGPVNGYDRAVSVAAAPGGDKVFVTGTSNGGSTSGEDYATVAYSAATGDQLWVARYNGTANGSDFATSLTLNPGGDKLFVTGYSGGAAGNDYLTVAYSTATGAQLWVRRYNGPRSGDDRATAVVSPGNGKVYVTGASPGTASGRDYATVAYSTATGAQAWVARYNGPGNRGDFATSVTASPDRAKVLVTGSSYGSGTSADDYATVAYNSSTGARLWATRYNGPGNRGDGAVAVAVNPAGGKVFVTGTSYGSASTGQDYATIAYSTGTGTQLWVRRYNGLPMVDSASALVVPGNGKIYVTGRTGGGDVVTDTVTDYATIAYNTTNGAQQWAARYNGPINGLDAAAAIAAGPGGASVFVTGWSAATSMDEDFDYQTDYATIGYQG